MLYVRTKGLEPPRLTAPDPKSGAATNYATSALGFNESAAKVAQFFANYKFSGIFQRLNSNAFPLSDRSNSPLSYAM